MTKIEAFLAKYSITTHTLAAIFVFLCAAYAGVPQVHDLFLKAYSALPGGVQQVVVAAFALYAWYRNGLSKA
jgi:hypothetical protein